MSVLKGSPEHLHQTSLRFREASRHSQEILKQIASMVQSLQAEWQGQAYQRFCQDFQQVHSRMYQSAGALEQLGRLLDQAAAKLMEAEQRAGGSVAAFGGGMSSGGTRFGAVSGTVAEPSEEPHGFTDDEDTPAQAQASPSHVEQSRPAAATESHPLAEATDVGQPGHGVVAPPQSSHEITFPPSPELSLTAHPVTSERPDPVPQASPELSQPTESAAPPMAEPQLASQRGAPVIEIVSDGDVTSATFVGGSGADETTLVVSAEIIDMGGKQDELAGYFSEPNASGAFPGATVAAQDHSGPLLGAHDPSAHDQNLNAPVAHSSASSDLHSNIQIVAEVARQKGLDPVMAVATMLVESGGDNWAVGDGGTSFGLFQLHQGGELGDMKPEQAFVPRTNAETSLSEFARIKDRHSDPGELAAAAQRPADPEEYARKVDAMLPEARKLLGM